MTHVMWTPWKKIFTLLPMAVFNMFSPQSFQVQQFFVPILFNAKNKNHQINKKFNFFPHICVLYFFLTNFLII